MQEETRTAVPKEEDLLATGGAEGSWQFGFIDGYDHETYFSLV